MPELPSPEIRAKLPFFSQTFYNTCVCECFITQAISSLKRVDHIRPVLATAANNFNQTSDHRLSIATRQQQRQKLPYPPDFQERTFKI